METPDRTSWLDTETKVALQKLPPEKLAPAMLDTFAVVVLSVNSPNDHARQTRAFHLILQTSLHEAERQIARTPPFVLKRKLTQADAMLAQFELVCANIVSIFLSDDVVLNAEPDYLASLYREMACADEFENVSIRVESIPDDENGNAFAEQFMGTSLRRFPLEMIAMRKKIRIMTHWANKIGAIVYPTVVKEGR